MLINRHHACFLLKHQMLLVLYEHNKRTGSISLLLTTISYKTLMSFCFVFPLSGLCILFKCPFVSSCASPHLPIGFLLPGRPSRSSPFVIRHRKWALKTKCLPHHSRCAKPKRRPPFTPWHTPALAHRCSLSQAAVCGAETKEWLSKLKNKSSSHISASCHRLWVDVSGLLSLC